MSENETEGDFIEPMERELGTVSGSFPFFQLRRQESSFRQKSGKVARVTQLRKCLDRFPSGTDVGQRVFVFFSRAEFRQKSKLKTQNSKKKRFCRFSIAIIEEKIRGFEFIRHNLFSCGINQASTDIISMSLALMLIATNIVSTFHEVWLLIAFLFYWQKFLCKKAKLKPKK